MVVDETTTICSWFFAEYNTAKFKPSDPLPFFGTPLFRIRLQPYRLAHAVRGEQLEEKTEAQFSVKKAVASQSAESLALARALQMRRTIMVRVALQEARLPPSRGRKPKLGKEPRVKATAAVVAKTQPRRLARPVAAADVVQAVEAALGRAVDVERLYLPVVETEDKVSIAITFRGGEGRGCGGS